MRRRRERWGGEEVDEGEAEAGEHFVGRDFMGGDEAVGWRLDIMVEVVEERGVRVVRGVLKEALRWSLLFVDT